MGNGQCHECEGCRPGKFWGHYEFGHKINCALALALDELGVNVIWAYSDLYQKRYQGVMYRRRWLGLTGRKRMAAWRKELYGKLFKDLGDKYLAITKKLYEEKEVDKSTLEK